MRYRILGPLQVIDGVRELAIGRGRQRALFAYLLLHANEVVSRDRLVDELWSENAPSSAAAMVHNHVSSLRKVFAAAGHAALETHGHGYRLRVEPGELDADEFERLVVEGRAALAAGRPHEAVRLLRQALALWSGGALADLELEPFVQSEAARLEDERLSALEDRLEAELALGRSAPDLVAELQGLVARHPLRERLRGAAMIALYRCGRQTDALAVFDEARHALVETLGLEPGPALQQLQRRVLEHDPTLAPADAAALGGRPGRERPVLPDAGPRRWPRRRVAATALVGVVAIAAIVAALRAAPDADAPSRAEVRIRGDSVVAIDPESTPLIAAVPVGRTPSDVVVGGGAVWSLNADSRTLSRIDPRTRTTASLATGREPTGIAADDDAAWVGSGSDNSRNIAAGVATSQLARIGARSRVIERTAPVRAGPRASTRRQQIAISSHAMWVIDGRGALTRLDVRSGRLIARVPGLTAIADTATARRVVALSATGGVYEVSPQSNRVTWHVRPPAESLDAVAVGDGSVWASDPADGVLWRVDRSPELLERQIDVGPGASGLAFGAGAVWVANPLRGTVTRVDPRSNRVVSTIRVGGVPRAVVVGAGAVWVAMSAGQTALTAAVSAPGAAGPAVAAANCGPVVSGPSGPPERLIVSDLPLQGTARRATALAMVQAIEFELRERHFLAGHWHVGLQSCDDSSAQDADTAGFDERLCAANAHDYVSTSAVIGVIGPLHSGCASQQLPILSPVGLVMISPASTYDRLTREDPTASSRELDRLYPSGRRTFARLSPTSASEAAADATLARRLGARRVWVLSDREEFGRSIAARFRTAARRLDLHVAGYLRWNRQASRRRAITRRVTRSEPDAVFLAGSLDGTSALLARGLRARLGPEPALIAAEFLPISRLVDLTGSRVARSMYVSLPGLTSTSLPAAGARFKARFGATQPGGRVPDLAVYAAQGADVLLDSIARSNGTRTSVVDKLLSAQIDRGLLGSFAFDHNGDTTQHAVTILRPRHAGGTRAVLGSEGATVDRVITPEIGLLR
jgi:DNA-binding SARP family transcriptional activator/ABC-type branched-subunit amino acid transport system substrate-binding protein